MDRLEEAIQRLSREFDSLTEGVRINIQAVADEERDRSTSSLAAAQSPDGIVTTAERTRDHLKHVIAEYRRFLAQVDQLEQVWLISEDLKQTVKNL